jgi:amino acid permease
VLFCTENLPNVFVLLQLFCPLDPPSLDQEPGLETTPTMAPFNRKKNFVSSVEASGHDSESGKYEGSTTEHTGELGLAEEVDKTHSLHRGLASRQITMIAIGGAIGTGLIIGTGKALATAG